MGKDRNGYNWTNPTPPLLVTPQHYQVLTLSFTFSKCESLTRSPNVFESFNWCRACLHVLLFLKSQTILYESERECYESIGSKVVSVNCCLQFIITINQTILSAIISAKARRTLSRISCRCVALTIFRKMFDFFNCKLSASMSDFWRGNFSTTSSSLLIASIFTRSLSLGCCSANFVISAFMSAILPET